MTQRRPFCYLRTSPEVIRLAVMRYMRVPFSMQSVEDLLHERGIEVSHETVRYWWRRFGPMFAAEIRGGAWGDCAPSAGAGPWTRRSCA